MIEGVISVNLQKDFMSIIDKNIDTYMREKGNYPALNRTAVPIAKPTAPITGRDMSEIRLGLRNPEKANVILLAEPGAGKTAYTQGFAYDAESVQYLVLSVDVERLAKDTNGDKDSEIANGLLDLVEEVKQYSIMHDIIIVLFMDEFHRITMLSQSSVEALKPILEKSAVNGFRIVAATTFEEYDQWITPNRALDQRLLRINLPELPRATVVNILKARAKMYGVLGVAEEGVFDEIYDTSKRILLSNAQPRASIDILLNIIGNITKTEYMRDGKLIREYATPEELGINSDFALSRPMLNKVIQRSYGIDIDNKISVHDLANALNTRILNQEQAVESVIDLLTLSLVGFGDPTRPKASFLSTGTTGTGKALPDDMLIPVPGGYKRNGDLQVGDVVFNREGYPVTVTGVYPRGMKRVYRVTLADGRTIDCADDHLWTYKSRSGNGAKTWKTTSTVELMNKPTLAKRRPDGRIGNGFVIPNNDAVTRPELPYKTHPYVLGTILGDGCITRPTGLEIASADESSIARVAELMGTGYKRVSEKNFSWVFTNGKRGTLDSRVQVKDVLEEVSEIIGTRSDTKFIPEMYKFGSIEQRWELIRGLFDTDGTISKTDRYTVSFVSNSKRLAEDVQEVLWSLGVMSTITSSSNDRPHKGGKRRNTGTIAYQVTVKSEDDNKERFFWLERKRAVAREAAGRQKQRVKRFDTVTISSIEELDYEVPMTCIMVDDEEHLYLAGKEHIVTHNTELAKVVSEVLNIPLKRFDMSRYSRPEDAIEFANSLAQAAWSAPDAYILIDEVEKSTREAMNILLQVLDDARLTVEGNANRVVSFTGNIINLTTNLGSEVYQNMQRYSDPDARIDTELIYQALAESDVFETAVLGRVDDIVPFKPLPQHAMEFISGNALRYNLDIVETDKRRILVSPDVIPYIVEDRTSKDSERGGARDAKRNVRNIILRKLAAHIATVENENPVIIQLTGMPRFKDETIADPMSADVMITECYPMDVIDGVLAKLSQRMDKRLYNDGLYVPKYVTLNEFAQDIVYVAQQGYSRFKTTVDNEKVFFDGVRLS